MRLEWKRDIQLEGDTKREDNLGNVIDDIREHECQISRNIGVFYCNV
jgi:hypothetical protein